MNPRNDRRPVRCPFGAKVQSWLGLVASIIVTGCVAASNGPVAPANAYTEAVISSGYQRIQEVYLEPVEFGTLTVDGLEGLATLDESVTVDRTADGVVLTATGGIVGSYRAPDDNDPDAWAHLAAQALRDAESSSPVLADLDREDLYEALFDAVAGDLDDYSRYVTPEEAEAERAARDGYGGIGILINFDEEAGLGFVEEVFDGAPAQRAGVQAGEYFLAVDGEPTTGWDLSELANRLRGPIGTEVFITLGTPAGTTRTISLEREQVIIDTVATDVIGNVGYIEISRFNAATADQASAEIADLLNRFNGDPAGLIIDLRGNPGGLLGQSVEIADMFLDRGDVITTRGRHPDSIQRYGARRGSFAPGVPMVVLVDGRSASGAEIVAAALQDSGRAVVVGASSFGKGSVQTVSRLPNGGELFLTWSRIYGPSGITIHNQGVAPTLCTSGDLTNASAIIEAFRSGRAAPPASLLAWRRVAADDPDALEQLRAICPWREHDGQLDVDVALQLLADPDLYARAINVSATVAQR